MSVDRQPLFRTARMREVYDMDEVDDFVDQVLATLDRRAVGPGLQPEEIEVHDFRSVRMREGYVMEDVDGWLDDACAELRQRAGAPASDAEPRVDPAVEQPGLLPGLASVPAASGLRSAGTTTRATGVTESGVNLIDPKLRDLDPSYRQTGQAPSPTPGAARSVARISTPQSGLHHVEIWVQDLPAASRSFGWLFERTGWTLFQVWENGRSWQAPDAGPYVVVEKSPDLADGAYDRRRSGLNHLAIALPERWMVDRVATEAEQYGWSLMFADRHPFAGGPHHYAAYLESADGFEVEIVAAG